MASTKPIPLPDDLTQPYWQAAAEGRLAIQCCLQCARFVHPPEAICPACNATNLRFRPVSGRGRVYSFTVVRDNITRGFEGQVPYVVALVELAEQPRLLVIANLLDVDPGAVHSGMAVEVTFERLDENTQIPQFRPASAS